jgi:alpha-1,3-glucosyltransferase
MATTIRSYLGLILLLSIILRILIACFGHSGEGVPPMYGDYEAQRHWMEVTLALPIGEWYRHTPRNDLLYWGLDYPPLTAYVSYICGFFASIMTPSLVEFEISRGYEGTDGKIFMRSTVLMADMLIFIPAVVLLWQFCIKNDAMIKREIQSILLYNDTESQPVYYSQLLLWCCLNVPSLLIIDHGHFQYNGVCIGFALASCYCLCNNQDQLASVLFCLSLNFKQMALYYAPVFFFALLAKCVYQRDLKSKIMKLMGIGSIVIFAFIALWLPFCLHASTKENETCVSSLLHVLSRLFPFNRGIFEDKVSNIWYVLSVLIDFRTFVETEVLIKCSLLLTVLLLVPTGVFLFKCIEYTMRQRTAIMNENKSVSESDGHVAPLHLCLSLVSSSLAFFLASFQVHEKSLLLALVPSSFLIPYEPILITWFQILGMFTMYPLLQKDQLSVVYVILIVINLVIVESFCAHRLHLLSPSAPSVVSDDANNGTGNAGTTPTAIEEPMVYRKEKNIGPVPSSLKSLLVSISFLGILALHLCELYVPAPVRYPHLYPALFSIYGACNLGVMYLLVSMWQYTIVTRFESTNKAKTD